MGNELTTTELTTLELLENTIQKSIASFIEIGQALMEIRDSRLYRQTHSTFEDYCRERWDMKKSRVYQLVGATAVAENVHDRGQIPSNEWQIRPLTRLEDPEQQKSAWGKACEKAEEENRNVVARDVSNAVKWVESKSSEPKPDPEPERMLPIDRCCVGSQFATMAIGQLKKIAPNDAERDLAYVKVVRWLANKRFPTSKAPLQRLFKLVTKESNNE